MGAGTAPEGAQLPPSFPLNFLQLSPLAVALEQSHIAKSGRGRFGKECPWALAMGLLSSFWACLSA
jgi:hypothetical protein